VIDTHCHLTDPRLGEQLDAVLQRAADAGIDRVISIGTGLADSRQTVAVAASRPNVFAAVGVHPAYAHKNPTDPTAELRLIQDDPNVVAIGEIGLEYHWDDAPRDVQHASFSAQLSLAAELDRPVIIHSREAIDDTLAILKNEPGVRCVFHCYTGTADEAKRVLDAGHLIGFTGAVTFKKNNTLREIAASVPDDRLLLETDSPYLSPEPVRKQKICEPAFVAHIATCVAQTRGTTVEALNKLTTNNAERFFRIPPPAASSAQAKE
jgi:TatD DNase family protein